MACGPGIAGDTGDTHVALTCHHVFAHVGSVIRGRHAEGKGPFVTEPLVYEDEVGASIHAVLYGGSLLTWQVGVRRLHGRIVKPPRPNGAGVVAAFAPRFVRRILRL